MKDHRGMQGTEFFTNEDEIRELKSQYLFLKEEAEANKKAKEAEKLFNNTQYKLAHTIYRDLESKGIKNSLIYQRLADSSEDIADRVFYLRKANELNCDTCEDKLREIRAKIKFEKIEYEKSLFSNDFKSILILVLSASLALCLIFPNYLKTKLFLSLVIPITTLLSWLSLATYCQVDSPRQIERCILETGPNRPREAVIANEKTHALSAQNQSSDCKFDQFGGLWLAIVFGKCP